MDKPTPPSLCYEYEEPDPVILVLLLVLVGSLLVSIYSVFLFFKAVGAF